jgi:8-oxo-dGTP pyrophosphatase MutT (NUDIX family)
VGVRSGGVSHDPDRPPRVRLLIVVDDQIALIERVRDGHTYYVLPGGGVEPGETFEEAGRREAMEELGVEIAYESEPYDETFGGQRYLYYFASIAGGTFGTGEWPDHADRDEDEQAEHGSYKAVWMPLSELSQHDIPAAVQPLLDGRPVVRMDRLDHVVLTVRDLERTAAFYAKLGLDRGTFAMGRTNLGFGGQKLNLHQAGAEFEPKAAAPTPGSMDLCFVAAVPMDVVLDQLARSEIPVVEGPVPKIGALGKMTSVYVRDPDGNLVEIATYDRR